MALRCSFIKADACFTCHCQRQSSSSSSLSTPFCASLHNNIRSNAVRADRPYGSFSLRSTIQLRSQESSASADPTGSSITVESTIEETMQTKTFPASLIAKESDGPALCIIIVGATGELAKSKIFPALFALFYNNNLPKNVFILGYSRTGLSDVELRDMISDNLTCRVDHQQHCGDTVGEFLSRVFYQTGGYDSCEGMQNLHEQMQILEGNCIGNRIFYLSIPHDVLHEVASCVSKNAQSTTGWTRVIVEKPFGHNVESSALQSEGLHKYLNEEQIYRIDHRLGKDLIENLTVLRFSNLVFEPLWSRTYIRNVQVVLSEDHGIGKKGRYFDKYGIIRDIVQSHLLQTIALFAMEPPVSLSGDDIRDEKVKVLRSMRIPTLQDVVLGQYKASTAKDGKSKIPGYLDEPDIHPESITPTFVAAVLYIDNARWDGVPFLIKAGMGLIKNRVEIRIQFRDVPGNLYRDRCGHTVVGQATNELVIQIQPDETILLKINNKIPGLGLQLDSSHLNLLYRGRDDVEATDSYERLIMDVIEGDNHLFIRNDELLATWNLLDPLLEEIEINKVAPELYQFGGRGPIGAYYLGAKHGVRWADD